MLVTDKLCMVQAGRNASVFYAPDKGLLLDIENNPRVGPSPYHFLQIFLFWQPNMRLDSCDEDDLQFELSYPTSELQCIVARGPVSMDMPMHVGSETTIGVQKITLMDVRQTDCRTWHFEYAISTPDYGFNHRTNSILQQMITGNTYTGRDVDGQTIPLSVTAVSGGKGRYTVELESVSRPDSMRVRGYTRIQNEDIMLPLSIYASDRIPATIEP